MEERQWRTGLRSRRFASGRWLADQDDRQDLGRLPEHSACGVGLGWAAEEPAQVCRVDGGRVRGGDPGAVAGGADVAGHGDRRAGRLDTWDDGVQGAVREFQPAYLPPDLAIT